MPWGAQQDELTQEARLSLASPEVVFEELKKLSAKIEFGRNDRLETVLVKRNHPLINLGLACYGANKDVFAALYKHSLEPPKNENDAQYKKGLRIGCLSNTALRTAHLIFDFPQEIIGHRVHFQEINNSIPQLPTDGIRGTHGHVLQSTRQVPLIDGTLNVDHAGGLVRVIMTFAHLKQTVSGHVCRHL